MRRKWIGLIIALVVVGGVLAWALFLRPPTVASAEEVARKTAARVQALKSYYAREVGETTGEQNKRAAFERAEWFRAPNLRRLEQTKPFKMISVTDGTATRTYYPDYDLLLISEPQAVLTDTLLPSERCPTSGTKLESLPCMKRGARMSGHEKVDGHKCAVLEWQEKTPIGKITMRVWVDEKMLLPRKQEVRFGSRLVHSGKLASLRVNERIPEDKFRLAVRAPKHTLRGNFEPESVGQWWPQLSKQEATMGGWSEACSQKVDFTVLRPGYYPKGARWIGLGCPGEDISEEEESAWWTSAVWPERDATLLIVERKARGALPGGKPHPIGEQMGALIEGRPPAGLLTLVWDQAGTRVKLQGGGLALEELGKIAASMTEKQAEYGPDFEGMPEFEEVSLEQAQREADFVIYLPTRLPKGAGKPSISFVGPEGSPQGGSYTPPQINVDYQESGLPLFINEMYSEGESWGPGGWETVKFDGMTGHYDKQFGTLYFVRGTTSVTLSGMSKGELVRIAKSLKPAAPQIKPQPHRSFVPGGGPEGESELSPEEAQRKADFRIYLPKPLPEGYGEPSIHWSPFKELGGRGWSPNQVSVSYPGPRSFHLLEQYDEFVLGGGRPDAERVKVKGTEAYFWKIEGQPEQEVVLTLGHTKIEIEGDLTKQELILIAESLEPVATHISPAPHEPLPKPRVETLSAEEAQRRVSFLVYKATYLPGGYKLRGTRGVSFGTGKKVSAVTEVLVEYGEGKRSLTLLQSAASQAPELAPTEGEKKVVLAPGRKALFAAASKDWAVNSLLWVQGKTHIVMRAPKTVSEGEMVRIAKSMVPAAPQIAREKGLLKE